MPAWETWIQKTGGRSMLPIPKLSPFGLIKNKFQKGRLFFLFQNIKLISALSV
jgi:hypothetical protein